jgi:hypothetical protein
MDIPLRHTAIAVMLMALKEHRDGRPMLDMSVLVEGPMAGE